MTEIYCGDDHEQVVVLRDLGRRLAGALGAVAMRDLPDGSPCFCGDTPNDEHFEDCGWCRQARAVLAEWKNEGGKH